VAVSSARARLTETVGHVTPHMPSRCPAPCAFKSTGVLTALVGSRCHRPLGKRHRSPPCCPAPQLTTPHVLTIATVPQCFVLPTQVIVVALETATVEDPPQSHPMPPVHRRAIEDHRPGAPPRYTEPATSQGACSTRRHQEPKPTAESAAAASTSLALDSSDRSWIPSTPTRASHCQGVLPDHYNPANDHHSDLPTFLLHCRSPPPWTNPPGEPPPLSHPKFGPPPCSLAP
jgi:hypothetical protein